MGKKSKNPSKKSKDKSEAAAQNTLQELQAGINSMSMKDALSAVQMATNSINQMKEAQKKAAEELKQARAEVDRSKLDKKDNDLYADMNYWEKRYKDETDGKSEISEIYEWYLDFEELAPILIPDIKNARSSISAPVGEVLIAGCGNSSMCEDIFQAGLFNICGMDYSQSVVDGMNRRLTSSQKQGGVRYLQADGTNMPSAMKSSCSAVVDKGTLDAITSGGVAEGGDTKGTRDALAYMNEMWRILQTNGVFIIISTMPPDLFHLVGSCIVPEISKEAKKNKNIAVRSGPGYRINSFKTKEGGSVFYYILFKNSSENSGTLNLSQDVKKTMSNSSKSDYEKLMLEAQMAMKELEEAQAAVKRNAAAASKISMDLRETEDKAEKLSKKLDHDLSSNVVTNILEEAKNESSKVSDKADENLKSLESDVRNLEKAYIESKKKENSHGSYRTSVDASVPLSLPNFPSSSDPSPGVSLQILPSSVLQTEGYVEVEFSIYGGNWDEDDFISLHQPTTDNKGEEISEYEYFEYTDEPKESFSEVLNRNVLTGKTRIILPFFGGPFQLTYRRTFTTIAQKTIDDVQPGEDLKENDAVVTRQSKVLSRSEIVQVDFPVQKLWKASGSTTKCRNLQKSRDFMNMCNMTSHAESPRNKDLMYMVEDLQSISVIAITVKANCLSGLLPEVYEGPELSRVSSWICNDGVSENDRVGLSIEADCCGKLSYLQMTLPLFPKSYNLQLNKAIGQVLVQKAAEKSRLQSSVVIRIPYDFINSKSNNIGVPDKSSRDKLLSGRLECSFCFNSLTSDGAIQEAFLLPSGKFDHMMHEFLCSENPVTPLSIGDMETGRGSILVGNIYLSVNAGDILGGESSGPRSVVLSCKTYPSIIDAINSEVSSSINSAESEVSDCGGPNLTLIDTSTCAVTCSRCGMYIGDGQVVDKDESDDHISPARGHFVIDDISNIRFLRHRVTWRGGVEPSTHFHDAMSILQSCLKAEQVHAHLLISASTLFGCSTFELYVPEASSLRLQIRMLSRPRDSRDGASSCGYTVYSPLPSNSDHHLLSLSNSTIFSKDAIKISYSFESDKNVNGTRLPLRRIAIEYSDFEEICCRLRSCEVWSSPSFQSNERIGYLLLQ